MTKCGMCATFRVDKSRTRCMYRGYYPCAGSGSHAALQRRYGVYTCHRLKPSSNVEALHVPRLQVPLTSTSAIKRWSPDSVQNFRSPARGPRLLHGTPYLTQTRAEPLGGWGSRRFSVGEDAVSVRKSCALYKRRRLHMLAASKDSLYILSSTSQFRLVAAGETGLHVEVKWPL